MSIQPFSEKIWLASPTMHGEEQAFVKEAFDTNWVSTVGANIDALEQGICEYVGAKNGVALSSGTSALHLCVKLANVKQGDVVFSSDMTFAATCNPIMYEKGTPVFIDSEGDTWNMDPKALEKAFEKYPDCKTVVVANLYGTPAKLDEIWEICEAHGATLIEDAAESLGATYKGRQTGTFGAYNAISFNGNKIITGSSGGMLLTDIGAAYAHAKKLSTQAREPFPWYQHEYVGYNYRMSNIIAGVARGQLLHLDEHIAEKKRIYETYKAGFADLPIQMNPFQADIMTPNYWLSCMYITDPAIDPMTIINTLADYNVESRPIWKPMHMQPVYKEYDFIALDEANPVNEDIFAHGLCLPSDITMTPEQQATVIEIVKTCF